MRVVVVTPPEPVVSWEEADAHIQLGGDVSQQGYVESLIAAATGEIDGPDGWLGRAIGVQTLEARFSPLTCERGVRLRFPPVIDLLTVKYLDRNDVEQTADLADFELLGDELVPARSSWPWDGNSLNREAVRVRYRAGYQTIPAPIKSAILLMTAALYENREGGGACDGAEEKLQRYRVYR